MNFGKPEKSKFWKKWKKIAADIILYKCTKSHHYMKYSSWDTELDKFFFTFWAIFLPFYPPPPPSHQNLKKMKKASWNVIILNFCNKKQSYDVSLLRYGVQQT